MSKPLKSLNGAAILLAFVVIAFSARGQGTQNRIWERLSGVPQGRAGSEIAVHPAAFQAFKLSHQELRTALGRAPRESRQAVKASPAEISLPMPDGSFATFRFVEVPVMAPELAAKFPEIKTYLGQGIDDPQAVVRFDLTPQGFHAQILSPHGAVYIDPYFRGDPDIHATYYKRNYRRIADDFQCLTPSGSPAPLAAEALEPETVSGATLRTYRLACAATGEYTQFHGGTVSLGMAAIVTAINRVTGIYEAEVAIRLELVGNNNLIVYSNPNTDPYNNNSGSTMLNQNQQTLDSIIGSANYDIGHVFSTGGGGIAGLGVVCVSGRKANGVTGLTAPIGDAFYVDYVAHEMGHQFGANHCFNSATGNCGGGNRNGSTAYEPGSGSTIMGYAGICGSDDLQPHSDPYFHSVSLDEIINYTSAGAGSGCARSEPTGNTSPIVFAGPNFIIPKSTPFALTATGSDANGDALTYCWEERDLGAATTLLSPDNGNSPLFRSFVPTSNPTRTFPKLSDILGHSNTLGEMLPTTGRTLNFRVVARDNRSGGGGISTANMQVMVSSNSGPFSVTAPNTAVTWSNVQTVTWNVAGTAGSPVNAALVNILLSTNGGSSFPIVLASNVPNDGAQSVLLPSITTSSARIKVAASANVFFDISDANFSIIKAVPSPVLVLESAQVVSESCPNNAIDPDETVTVNFALRNIGAADTTNLVVSLLGNSNVIPLGGAQPYGLLVAGGSAVTLPISFKAEAAACGSAISTVLQLQDGGEGFGTITQNFSLGNAIVTTSSWANATPVTIPAPGDTRGAATPYPSTLFVSGLTGTVSKVTVTLNNLSHSAPDDIDVLLVGPAGQTVLLMSDAGNGGPVNNATLTFDDAAASSLPSLGVIGSGVFKPSNFDGSADGFPAPAPDMNYGATLSLLNGANPNGSWSLYVYDDFKQNSGSLAQGWSLTIVTSNRSCCVSSPPLADLALSNSVVPSVTGVGDQLAYKISVVNLGPGTAAGVTVTDALPAGVSFVSAVASQGTCYTNGALVSAVLGTLANGAIATVNIVVTPEQAGSVTNRAWVTATSVDPDASNDFMAVVSTVNHINQPPSLSPIGDRTVHAGSTVSLTASAVDPDLPSNVLTYSLSGPVPAGASIDSTTGVFSWPTSDADIATTHTITIRVVDNGFPNLSDEKSFDVRVIARPIIQSITESNGSIQLSWTAIAGNAYRVQSKAGLNDAEWSDLQPDVVAESELATKTDSISSGGQRFYRVLVLP